MVVIDGDVPGGDPRISVLTLDRRVARVTVQDFTEPVETLARVKMPKGFNFARVRRTGETSRRNSEDA